MRAAFRSASRRGNQGFPERRLCRPLTARLGGGPDGPALAWRVLWTRGAARACLVVVEHEQAHGGRQIAFATIRRDGRQEIRQRPAALRRDVLQPLPKRVLEADARLVASNHDRSFYHWGLHLLILCVHWEHVLR